MRVVYFTDTDGNDNYVKENEVCRLMAVNSKNEYKFQYCVLLRNAGMVHVNQTEFDKLLSLLQTDGSPLESLKLAYENCIKRFDLEEATKIYEAIKEYEEIFGD